MSRDSSATHIHMRSSRLADVFEEFCRPPSSTVFAPAGSTTAQAQQSSSGANANANINSNGSRGTLADGSGMTAVPGHYLPFEEIALPLHLMPINPEDEDDVVPDMHAAFGINRALNQTSAAPGVMVAGAASAVAGGVGGSGGAMGSGEPTGEASHAGVMREPIWRDLGLDRLMADVPRNQNTAVEHGEMGRRREGRRTGLLLLR
ncbi:hypothetical protein G647_07836 [Cladophialophora carrionii CBS 160.54]|uniref:Uncharacterized protein n=1 Tax=Cladophialophora carrionii CBS 160.54 TaxID=1279043 RepID=V9D3L2_9EURO|nr:uncharacterized protein G647_07836 [Cladophialophora carrionii CBS 160.54]ETI21489.1 hypothetical protein G647_07836 [Cladophialophora carrionii CBS 160.54]